VPGCCLTVVRDDVAGPDVVVVDANSDQSIPLDDFFRSTQGKFRTPLVQSWVHELTTQRDARKAAAAAASDEQ
jgi:hypothetical protein